jgi:hypothetical protein
MEGNVRMYRAKIKAGEMTEAEAEAILGKSVWEAQGKLQAMWPTPTTQEVEHPKAELTETGRRKSKNNKTSHSLGLADAVQMWPTARASAAMADSPEAILRNLKKKGYKSKLEQAVQLWPTPRAAQAEARNHTVYSREFGKPQNLENRIAQRDPSAIGGKLNPMWVEWLMGFPLGWTDLED